MTYAEIELAKALGSCSYPPGTSQKRFARDILFLAENDPDKELSDRQRHYMQLMAWRYRRQMPSRLVPERQPDDLPPQPKVSKRKVKTDNESSLFTAQ
jgi:hypothetical protein